MEEKMKNLPAQIRPYEKCLARGAEVLDDAELLAVILRSGVPGKNSVTLAREILKMSGGTLAGLYGLSADELKSLQGIGDVKAVQIRCILELSKRIAKSRKTETPRFESAAFTAEYFMEDMRHLDHEELRAVYLDTRGGYICDRVLSKGSIRESMVPTREILVEALKAKAVQMILIHNHPSGDPTPSAADILVTRSIAEAGRLSGIPLLDHIVIGDGTYASMSERGLLE